MMIIFYINTVAFTFFYHITNTIFYHITFFLSFYLSMYVCYIGQYIDGIIPGWHASSRPLQRGDEAAGPAAPNQQGQAAPAVYQRVCLLCQSS